MTNTLPYKEFVVNIPIATALILAASAAPATHWVPIATGPDSDPTGLYFDSQSISGNAVARTVREKFVNSYREQRLSLVEINCIRKTWRTLSSVVHSPRGLVIRSEKSDKAKIYPISHASPQEAVWTLVCKISNGRVKR